jgi:hypothetical protein
VWRQLRKAGGELAEQLAHGGGVHRQLGLAAGELAQIADQGDMGHVGSTPVFGKQL